MKEKTTRVESPAGYIISCCLYPGNGSFLPKTSKQTCQFISFQHEGKKKHTKS